MGRELGRAYEATGRARNVLEVQGPVGAVAVGSTSAPWTDTPSVPEQDPGQGGGGEDDETTRNDEQRRVHAPHDTSPG